jgi:hypothetical protein
MALTDVFVKAVQPTGKASGDKFSDSEGLYLLVKPAGKYWRFDYRFAGKRKTLALGVYGKVSLKEARKLHASASKLLSEGKDPSEEKQKKKAEGEDNASNTFKAIALEWHQLKAKGCADVTTAKRLMHLERHLFPAIGRLPVASIKPFQILKTVTGSRAKWNCLHCHSFA